MTSVASVRTAIERTAAQATKWTLLPAAKKLEYLQNIRSAAQDVFWHWGFRSLQIRNWDSPSHAHLVGNAMLISSGMLGMHIDSAIATYSAIASTGKPPALKTREYNGQKILNVFPHTLLDALTWPLYSAEVWVQPGKPATQGAEMKSAHPGTAAILGAGNYEAPVDILTKLFVENKVVVYKSHPNTSAATDRVYAHLFKSLVDDGYVSLVSGGLEVGETLLGHKDVGEILMTGGCQAYDCIMWGGPSEQAANKKAGRKKLTKKMDAELGAVSPWIVVPGKWSNFMLKHQVEWLCASKAFNGGALCASPQVVIVDKKWPQYDAFIKEIRDLLGKSEPTPYWYPGSAEKQKNLESACKGPEWLPKDSKWQTLFLPNCGRDSIVLKEEAFSPVLAVLAIDTGNDPKHFLAEATKIANDEIMGSLSMTMAISPSTRRSHSDAFQKALAELKWGTIGVNEWGGAGLFFGNLCWGAHYGRHTPEDIQSGEGFIGNHKLIDFPQKSILQGTWFSLNHGRMPSQTACNIYERTSWLTQNPSYGRLIGVAAAIAGIY